MACLVPSVILINRLFSAMFLRKSLAVFVFSLKLFVVFSFSVTLDNVLVLFFSDDINKAYRKLAVLLHPDKSIAPGTEEAFKILVNARTALLQ